MGGGLSTPSVSHRDYLLEVDETAVGWTAPTSGPAPAKGGSPSGGGPAPSEGRNGEKKLPMGSRPGGSSSTRSMGSRRSSLRAAANGADGAKEPGQRSRRSSLQAAANGADGGGPAPSGGRKGEKKPSMGSRPGGSSTRSMGLRRSSLRVAANGADGEKEPGQLSRRSSLRAAANVADGAKEPGTGQRALSSDGRTRNTNVWIAQSLPIGGGPTVARLSAEKFDFVKVVGRGMMGVVSLARYKKDGGSQYVAIKAVAKAAVLKRKNDERHLRNERRILGRLRHPFVVALFGTFQDARRVYFVLEYVAGGELFQKLREGAVLSAEAAKFYLAEILSALAHVHGEGFAYRDLKPENVLLDPEGHCRLVDFGLACAPPGPDPDAGRMHTACGTPAYLSPDQLSSKTTGGYTRAVDWWALGCVTYELLTGRTPFCRDHHADSHHAIYLRVITGRVAFPRTVPPLAKACIRALLCADGARRLTTAAAIKNHAFFNTLDWPAVDAKRLRPPSEPLCLNPGDTSCFDADEALPLNDDADAVDTSQANFDGF